MTAKRTPLYETHLSYGGRMVEFGGWSLPVQYSGIKEEHLAVRTKAGLFDVSHMGEFLVTGKDALDFLQKVVTNDVARLQENQILYSPMCYNDGGTVDDLLIYKYSAEQYLAVVNAANIDKDWAWMEENQAGFAVTLENLSDQTAQLALQGPLAKNILVNLTEAPLADLTYYWFWPEVIIAGKKVLLSRTGYTGEDGFELYCDPEDAAELWEAIMEVGKPMGLLPAGLGCRDTLRFEVCFPLYGHELTAEITPIEAGIGFFVKVDKENFNGKEVLAKQKQTGPRRKLVGIEMVGRGVARAEYPVFCGEARIGQITTGSYGPSLDKNLGLALINSAYTQIGQELFVEIRGKKIAAQVISKPFYKREEK
ncbi:MAG: glycine cleavage system aminomethyltransferase GcvT [Sporomusaceae bacterium]|nr:glycine cleavage system aminomethyltransferase GcvT [Sporomusaceae bacterium]